MANIHWQDVFKVLIHLPKHAIRHIYLFIYFFLFFFVVTCSWPKAKVQVRDCRASLWTTSVRWVMSCCWAWCLMYSSVRTWSRDGWGWGGQYSCPVQADKSLEWWVCVCVNSPTSGSRSTRACGWGSTGWQTAGSVCCSSGPHEPTGHQTGKRPEHPDAVYSAAATTHCITLQETVTHRQHNKLTVFWCSRFCLTSSLPSAFRWSRICPIKVSHSLLSSDRNLGSPPYSVSLESTKTRKVEKSEFAK